MSAANRQARAAVRIAAKKKPCCRCRQVKPLDAFSVTRGIARLALLTTRPIAPAECRSGTPRTYTQNTIDRRVAAAQIGGTALSRQAAGSHFVAGAGTVGRRLGGGLLGRLMGVVVDCGAPRLPGPGACLG